MSILNINKFFANNRSSGGSGVMPLWSNAGQQQTRTDYNGSEYVNRTNRRWFLWGGESQRWGSENIQVGK